MGTSSGPYQLNRECSSTHVLLSR